MRSPLHRASWGLAALAALVAVVSSVLPSSRSDRKAEPPTRTETEPRGAYVPNLGQWDASTRYVGHFGASAVWLERRGWVLQLQRPESSSEERGDASNRFLAQYERGILTTALRMTFEGASEARLEPEQRLPGHHNYFLGRDPERWRSHVPRYGAVRYEGLYPGVDLVMRRSGGHPEYDLLFEPGSRPDVIVRVAGARGLRLGDDGSLVIETALGPVVQPVPRTWQTAASGDRREVRCRYVILDEHRFGFHVERRDPALALTIDPGLVWSTYLGEGYAHDVFVDDTGIVTVVGTGGHSFPVTPGAFQQMPFASGAVVSQLAPTGAGNGQLIYSTFLGAGMAIAVDVDARGQVLVVGSTASANFPVTPNAYDDTYNGARDAFVVVLDPSKAGSAQLVYSSYLGGASLDAANDVVSSTKEVVTLAGGTLSSDFPTAPQGSSSHGGFADAFIAQLDLRKSGQSQLVYSTYVGGIGVDSARSVTVEPSGCVTISGVTGSTNYPTTANAFARTHRGGRDDVFVTRVDPVTAQILYSTFLGGADDEWPTGHAQDQTGAITVAGRTYSGNFPLTRNAFATRGDSFATRLEILPSATRLDYSTRFPGWIQDVFADTSGVITVHGIWGMGIPTTPGAFMTAPGGGFRDFFVSRLDPERAGNAQLLYSTYVGGRGLEADEGAIDVDGRNVVTLAGTTPSRDYPTTPGAFKSSPTAPSEIVLTQLDMLPDGAAAYGTSSPGCDGPLAIGVSSWPQQGNGAFTLTCDGAPAASSGVLLLGSAPLATPVSLLGAELWVDLTVPHAVLAAGSNGRGAADVPLPLPPSPSLVGKSAYAQFLWSGPAAPPAPCPPAGVSASNALEITVQP